MNTRILARQAITLCRIVLGHLSHDPVVFGLLVFRRLPLRVSQSTGAALALMPGTVAAAASSWLTGDVVRSQEYVKARPAGPLQARILGELALSMGDRRTAIERADDLVGTRGGILLASRIRWNEGRMSDAVAIAPPGKLKLRLAAELRTFQQDWTPRTTARGAAPTPRGMPTASVLFSLTNSLPHTQSGYTLRTHAVLSALREAGVQLVAVDRTGYPTDIGRPVFRDRSQIDGVDYFFDIPSRLANSIDERLEQQANFLVRTAKRSGAQVIHTTTHFTNGLAAGAAARELEIPWVYEVRGSLEDTWAASHGEEEIAARQSERYKLFRARETQMATEADHVITLGATMAEDLVHRGVSEEKILIAPNSVGKAVLKADWRTAPESVREQLGLPRAGMWVGTAASVVGYEGLDILVDAVEIARANGTDIRLLVAGGGIELPALRLRAKSLGQNAIFTGPISAQDARRHVQALDVFVVPRKDVSVCRKITPLKPVEAGGLGKAVVLSDLAALTESLPVDAHCAVKAGSSQDLATALVQLYYRPEERARLGTEARRYVEENRTWSSLGETYRGMYEKLGVSMKGAENEW